MQTSLWAYNNFSKTAAEQCLPREKKIKRKIIFTYFDSYRDNKVKIGKQSR